MCLKNVRLASLATNPAAGSIDRQAHELERKRGVEPSPPRDLIVVRICASARERLDGRPSHSPPAARTRQPRASQARAAKQVFKKRWHDLQSNQMMPVEPQPQRRRRTPLMLRRRPPCRHRLVLLTSTRRAVQAAQRRLWVGPPLQRRERGSRRSFPLFVGGSEGVAAHHCVTKWRGYRCSARRQMCNHSSWYSMAERRVALVDAIAYGKDEEKTPKRAATRRGGAL